jgi:hypothetical protein
MQSFIRVFLAFCFHTDSEIESGKLLRSQLKMPRIKELHNAITEGFDKRLSLTVEVKNVTAPASQLR